MRHAILIATVLLSQLSHAMEPKKKEPKQGILIAIEGIDGSGKSTLAAHLCRALEQQYKKVFLTQEPGGTGIGKKISEFVQTQTTLDPEAEFLLFAAARAQHFTEIIAPLHKSNWIIISDRCADSSLAYQGYGRGLDKNMIKTTNQRVMKGVKPDLTIFVDVPVKVAIARINKRNNNISTFEKEDLLKKVADGFEKIFSNYQGKYIRITGTDSEAEVAKQTINTVQNWLKNDLKI